MTTSDHGEMNPQSNLPRRISLGDVLSDIKVTPGEITAFLSDLARQYLNGAHHNLGRALMDHAMLVSDPQTYGYKPPEQPATAGEEPYAAPMASGIRYADVYGSTQPQPTQPQPSPAAQGQSQPFETIGATSSPSASEMAATPQRTPIAPSPVEPQWMRDARAAGWRSGDEERKEQDNADAERERANPAVGTSYTPPAGPPVDPQYRAPYTTTAPAAFDVQEQPS